MSDVNIKELMAQLVPELVIDTINEFESEDNQLDDMPAVREHVELVIDDAFKSIWEFYIWIRLPYYKIPISDQRLINEAIAHILTYHELPKAQGDEI